MLIMLPNVQIPGPFTVLQVSRCIVFEQKRTIVFGLLIRVTNLTLLFFSNYVYREQKEMGYPIPLILHHIYHPRIQ